MDIKKLLPVDLLVVIILVLLTNIFVVIPYLNESPLRIIFGLIMVLFLPGYALIAALFPGKDDLDGIERLALSFGLSIAVVPLMGLALNYTPWGIRLVPILASIIFFTVIMTLIAAYRRQALGEFAFTVPFEKIYDSARSELKTKPESKLDRILTIVLVLSILLAAVTLVYVVVTPKQGEKFTEFYILGPGGMADNYTTQLQTGESVDVIVGIVNHEYASVNYSVVIRLDNETIGSLDGMQHVNLAHNETWEQPVSFIPRITGDSMKLQYLLYREDNMTEPYRDLHLWINVTESSNLKINESTEMSSLLISH